MSIQILDIVLYSHHGESRALSLKPGEVNVITGASKTGKSALIDIVDYCLGSGSCRVPDGIIRRSVSWFGLRLKIGDGQSFVARKCPSPSSNSSEECYLVSGADVEIPDFERIHQNTNTAGIVSSASGWAGIVENIHIPPEGQTRNPLAATIRHGLMFCFQPQDEIIRRAQLFHMTDDHWKAQGLKDTLPYFLGAVEDEYIRNQMKLRDLKSKLRVVTKQIAELEALRGEGFGKVNGLLAEARDAGLNPPSVSEDWSEIIGALKEVSSRPISNIEDENTGSQEYDRLSDERENLLNEQRHVRSQIAAAKSLESAESGFAQEAREQEARLVSIGIFDENIQHSCPLCATDLSEDSESPQPESIRQSLDQISEQLKRVSRNSPYVEKAIAELSDGLRTIQERLGKNREEMLAVRQADERLRLLKDESAKKAHVLGRISLYLESIPELPSTINLTERSEVLISEIKALEALVSTDVIQEKLESILSLLSLEMTEWAQHLELEHSERPLRFNLKKLTIVADSPDGPIPMERMGSGENWVGYHLIGHLAFHRWFTKRNRPVPHFLFLDQPSQVYFPPEPAEDRSVEDLGDDDRTELRRMFKMVFDAVNDAPPGFQVIITEHADINEQWYQDSIRERWRGGLKLVPEDWPSIGA